MLFKKMIQKEGPYIYENKFKEMVETPGNLPRNSDTDRSRLCCLCIFQLLSSGRQAKTDDHRKIYRKGKNQKKLPHHIQSYIRQFFTQLVDHCFILFDK